MPTIAHLIDDIAVGGVNRMLADQTRALTSVFTVSELFVNPRRPLPPRVEADVAVVHFTPSWSKLPFLTFLRAQRGDQPLVIVEHTFTRSFEELCVPHQKRFRKMLRLSYRLADVVVAVSEGQAEWMREAELVPEGKLRVIQPSVDCSRMLAVRPAERRREGPLRLAAYGRFSRQKGFDVLIEAMRDIAPECAKLTIAGYGPDEAELRKQAADLAHVRISGAIKDPAQFLAEFDAVVVPSRWEAFGLVTLEARAAGRPVIATRVDGLPEQIAEGTGMIVEPENPHGLVHAIRTLAQQDTVASGGRARRSMSGHFDRHVAAWTGLLDELLNAGLVDAGAAAPLAGAA